MRVGIDLDGVVYDFAGAFRDWVVRMGVRKPEQCPPATRWEFYEDWGLTLAEFLYECHRAVNSEMVFRRGPVEPGSAEAFERLRAAGHTLHVATDRNFGDLSERSTRVWMRENRLPYDSITFTADKTIIRVDTMIEDKLSNYDALEAAGSHPFLFDRPWNQDPTTPRRRVRTLAEFVDRVEELNV